MHPSEVKALLTNGTIKSSTMASVSDLKPPTSQDNTDPDEANEKSIMNLLLAAAAKCKNHQPNGMVKAASTSELEASNSQSLANDPELEPVRKKNDFGPYWPLFFHRSRS